MGVTVNYKKAERGDILPMSLSEILPYKLYGEIVRLSSENLRIEEIRCRLCEPAFVTCGQKNIRLSYVADKADMEYMTDKLCGGSLYAHRETLAEGYVTLGGGVRVGVCGRAVSEGGSIIGIYDISSLNFRLPNRGCFMCEHIVRLLREGRGGVLIYSPPGVGKTTLLRSVAAQLSSGVCPIRVCIVDTRGELSVSGGSADILVGYPKGKGIEIATRVMNPELIICDEIGDDREAEAILSAQNSGVPLLASAHGDSLSSLLRRGGLRRLHEGGVFAYYAGIKRGGRFGEFIYDITERQKADACI